MQSESTPSNRTSPRGFRGFLQRIGIRLRSRPSTTGGAALGPSKARKAGTPTPAKTPAKTTAAKAPPAKKPAAKTAPKSSKSPTAASKSKSTKTKKK